MSDPVARVDPDDPAVVIIGPVRARLPRRVRSVQPFPPDFIFAFLDRNADDPPGFELVALGLDGTIRWRMPPGRDGYFVPPGWIEPIGDAYALVDADRAFAVVALVDGTIVLRP